MRASQSGWPANRARRREYTGRDAFSGQPHRHRVQVRRMTRRWRTSWPAAAWPVLGLLLSGPRLAAQVPGSAHPGEYAPADIAYGSRLYDAQCTTCHSANGDGVGGVDLRSGKFRKAVTDQDLGRVITNGIPGTGMQAFKFDTAELTGVIAFIRNMNSFDRGSVKPGDAARGRALFDGKGQCRSCHRVDGEGPRSAPDLSDVGANRSAASLLRSLTDPSSQMMPINRPIRAVTRDGKEIKGR